MIINGDWGGRAYPAESTEGQGLIQVLMKYQDHLNKVETAGIFTDSCFFHIHTERVFIGAVQ